MKICMLGDFHSNDGVAVGNRLMRDAWRERDIIISDGSNKLIRLKEMVKQIYKADVVYLCSPSKMNVLSIIYAKKFEKPIFYRAHGLISQDHFLAETLHINKMLWWEKFCFLHCDKTIWPSKFAMDLATSIFPEIKPHNKFCYVYNPIDICSNSFSINENERKKNYIISIGGGRKQKNNITVAKAIYEANKLGYDFHYIVLGKSFNNIENLLAYPFVEYKGELSHEKTLQEMRKCAIFVLNTSFDTYSLASVEALMNGCAVLLSNNAGVVESFTDIQENDVIMDSYDICEIGRKIINLHLKSNNTRLRKKFLYQTVNPKRVSDIIYNMMKDKYFSCHAT